MITDENRDIHVVLVIQMGLQSGFSWIQLSLDFFPTIGRSMAGFNGYWIKERTDKESQAGNHEISNSICLK